MLDLIKDHVHINNLALLENKSDVYDFDCIIPDSLPDMLKILAADAYAETDIISKTNGNATISFKINYKILYLSETDKKIKSFSAVSEHTVKVSAGTIKEDDILKVTCRVENVDAHFINSRKISVKTTVCTEVLQKSVVEVGICTGISGADDIQLQKEITEFSSIAESVSKCFDIDEEIELSSGKAAYGEILRSDAILSDVAYSVIGDKLQIKGTILLCTFYIADDINESVQIIENEIPFAHSIEINTIGENIVWHAESHLTKFIVEASADLDGEMRILHINASICVDADAFSSFPQEYLTDAYSLSQRFSLNSSPVTSMLAVDNISEQFVLKDIAVKSEDLPDITQIVNVTAALGQYTCTPNNGKVSMDGYVVCNILYLSEDENSPVASFSTKIPFSYSFECSECTDNLSFFVKAYVNHISFNILSPSETELRISVVLKGNTIKLCEFSNICEITQPDNPFIESDGNKPAILLYVVQLGDSLWKIAKKYNAPLELLKEINQLKNPDLIYPGQKILIPG